MAQYRIEHSVQRHGKRRQPVSQIVFAQRAGVSVGCLQSFENASHSTTLDKARKIAAACETTIEQLLAADDDAWRHPASSAPTVPAVAPSVPPAMGHDLLTDEDLELALMLHFALTEIRADVKERLKRHFLQRSDRHAVALRTSLETLRQQSSGVSSGGTPEKASIVQPSSAGTFRAESRERELPLLRNGSSK